MMSIPRQLHREASNALLDHQVFGLEREFDTLNQTLVEVAHRGSHQLLVRYRPPLSDTISDLTFHVAKTVPERPPFFLSNTIVYYD